MANRYSIPEISLLKGRKIFFDTNILIYLFWPTISHEWQRVYSGAFGSLLFQKNELFVDFLVISEVINRAFRIEYDKFLLTNSLEKRNYTFKTFRESAEGKTVLEDIYIIVKDNILPTFHIQGKAFSKADIESFLHVEPLDFMDKALIPICKENEFILLTNDKDFSTSDIEILSSNRSLIGH